MNYEATIRRISEIEKQLAQLSPGYVVYKNIRGKKQPYLQWNENGKPRSQYIKIAGREETIAKAMLRKELTAELKELKASLPEQPGLVESPAYHTNVVYGEKLNAQIRQVIDYERRDCYKLLKKFLSLKLAGEDIVLLETVRALPKNRKAFKLILSRNEFDMVIYTSGENTCEIFEIKHSAEIVPRQYHVLEDEEQCSLVEEQYGIITRKCVIYRGPGCMLENGIEYLNAEEYLKSLS